MWWLCFLGGEGRKGRKSCLEPGILFIIVARESVVIWAAFRRKHLKVGGLDRIWNRFNRRRKQGLNLRLEKAEMIGRVEGYSLILDQQTHHALPSRSFPCGHAGCAGGGDSCASCRSLLDVAIRRLLAVKASWDIWISGYMSSDIKSYRECRPLHCETRPAMPYQCLDPHMLVR